MARIPITTKKGRSISEVSTATDLELWCLADHLEEQAKTYPTKGERTRCQLKAAAARILAEKGFYGMQMKDICMNAGLSKGAVYKYFTNKTEITAEVMTDFFELTITRLKSLETEGDEYSKIYEAILLWIRFYSHNVGLVRSFRQLGYEDGPFAEISHSHTAGWCDVLAGYIGDGTRRGTRRSAAERLVSWAFAGMTISVLDEVYERLVTFAGMADSPERAAETLSVFWYRQAFAQDPPDGRVRRNHPLLAMAKKRNS